jgi:hypothetical protein
MTIVVDKYQDEPIIFATMTEPMNFYQEIPNMFARILELRDSIQGFPNYYTIVDMTGIKADFSEIVFSLGEARKASQKRRPEFPNEVHLVGSGDLFEMVAKALSQFQYGGYTAPLHSNTEEALETIRFSQREK